MQYGDRHGYAAWQSAMRCILAIGLAMQYGDRPDYAASRCRLAVQLKGGDSLNGGDAWTGRRMGYWAAAVALLGHWCSHGWLIMLQFRF